MNNKYTLLLLAGLTAGAGAWAQRTTPRGLPAFARLQPAQRITVPARHGSAGVAKDGGDVVWSEDFANGFNSANGLWTTDGPNGNIWAYTFDGPLGAYSSAAEALASPSAANGWMLFNGDSANCTWSNGTPTALDPSAFSNWDGGLVSPVINLSATPFVKVTFAQRARYCCGDAPNFLQVSTDGGTTWSSSFPTVTVGANVDAQDDVSINIAGAISANPANVRLRFFHDGSNAGTSHYHWQIDDIQIVELFNYDLNLSASAISSWDPATAATYDSLRYSIYPFGQLRPVPLNMTIVNEGSADQPGITANFTVTEGANTVLDQDQTVDVDAGTSEKVFVSPDFVPPTTAGTYNVAFSYTSAVGDTSTGNDAGTASFKVDDFKYARDLGTVIAFENGEDADGNTDGEYEMCNGFHVAEAGELYAIDVALRSGGTPSAVGFTVTGMLRAGDLETDIAETAERTIAASDLNGNNGTKFVSLIFNDPQPLEAGTDYIVCVKHYGGFELRTGINGVSEPQSSFIFFNGQAGLDWYFTTSTPMVRMNFNPSVGISEADRQNGVGLGQNFPNPAVGTTTIPYDLVKGAKVTLEVQDVSGKVVRTVNLGDRAAGSHRFELNTNAMPEGVYFYTLAAGDVRLTKRMTVLH
jgi:hypothetical protein